MPLDVTQLLQSAEGQGHELFRRHVNPRLARVLQTIGFDRHYVRGAGAYLWDVEGEKYLDLLGGYGVFAAGRNHPDIRLALERYLALDYPSLVQLDAPLLCGLLAKALVERVPYDLDTVFFTNSGNEGIEAAIKYARCATGRPAILYCRKAFHGLTNGALSVCGDDSFRQGFEPLLPDCRCIEFDDLDGLESALSVGDVAAFVVEPIQGKGVNIPSKGYLAAAADLCHRHGALFVADEVQTGVGRTGRFLALQHEDGVDPDIVVISKALSGGYAPVGAVMIRRRIYDRVFSRLDRAVVHSSTFGKGGLGMVAGLAMLTCLDEHELLARAEHIGNRIGAAVESMATRFEFIREVRWRGAMIGIEFDAPRSLALRSAWFMVHRLDGNLFPQAVTMPLFQDHRILTQVAGHNIDVVKLLPPLVTSDKDIAWFLEGFEDVMTRLHRFPGPVWESLSRIGRRALRSPHAASRPGG